MTTQIISQDSLAEALVSSGRSPEIAPADDVYGWLIGSWKLDVAATALTFPLATSRAKFISDGCWKAVLSRMYGL
jgi:hypothetical protein